VYITVAVVLNAAEQARYCSPIFHGPSELAPGRRKWPFLTFRISAKSSQVARSSQVAILDSRVYDEKSFRSVNNLPSRADYLFADAVFLSRGQRSTAVKKAKLCFSSKVFPTFFGNNKTTHIITFIRRTR
jgi:hypothetical protein